MQWLLKKFIGTKNERDLKKIRPLVDKINALDEEYTSLSDDALKAKTDEFRDRIQNKGEHPDDVLPEAFAVVKNACRRLVGTVYEVCDHDRTWVEVPYDVQMIGGIAMHQGYIAEMATGEGKTLVATAPAYLNALTGKGVHVVTVNDYLARRDAEWMGLVFGYLGLTVGCLQGMMPPPLRREQYNCDITYGTNSEFGFDYLRDNMANEPAARVQRHYNFAIIDEIDSILIDEARTPLIISGQTDQSSEELYLGVKPLVQRLVREQRKVIDDMIKKLDDELKKAEEEQDTNLLMNTLYQVHQGMPKHPALLRHIEEPSVRRMLEKANDRFLTDMYKEMGRELRQALLFTIDEKGHDANLTDRGTESISPNDPEAYVLPDLAELMSDLDGNAAIVDEERIRLKRQYQEEFTRKSESIHAVDQLIRAYCIYEKDVEYVVENNQVIIVDVSTGRKMEGRRWSDGLHQAVEAKEGVKIEKESQTLATITIQNYFRMYEKLSGMTGTAETEADEFHQIYGLDVLVIPTNRPVRRVDSNDLIFRTQREKYDAVVDEVTECYRRKQPVLVGTVSVESSEHLSRLLRRKNIPHNVLNAKNHEREADIVARAGQPGSVTIATNMAGRGTDIKLGEGVVKLPTETIHSQIALSDSYEGVKLVDWINENPCGLYVIGTERHESRRIDRQLRGRCSRQGDPGMSRFYVSLEDPLMRMFGAERISTVMSKLGVEEGEPLEHGWLNKSVERAQRRVEQYYFWGRKRTLEYDDVMNRQREIIYDTRTEILTAENPRDHMMDIIDEVIEDYAMGAVMKETGGDVDFADWVSMTFPVALSKEDLSGVPKEGEAYAKVAQELVKKAYEVKIEVENPETLPRLERDILLYSIDTHWQEYLRNMDSLKQGIQLRAYGQRDPILEYKHEAYTLFEELMCKIHQEVAQRAFRATTSIEALEQLIGNLKRNEQHAEVASFGNTAAPEPEPVGAATSASGSEVRQRMEQAMESAVAKQPIRRDTPKVGRNDPCPCGSGKKYKKCCGAEN